MAHTTPRPTRSNLALWLLAGGCIGILWRLIRFAINLQIHGDDAYLLNNVLLKDWRDLLMPLANDQVAPPIFLWLEKWQCIAFESDMGPRIWPFLAGMLSLLLMAFLCRRWIRGTTGLLAFAIFSVTHTVATFTVRSKPYSTDLLVGIAMTCLALEYMKQPRRLNPLFLMAAIAAFAVWSSYTALFVLSGIGLVLCAFLWSKRQSLSIRPVLALGFYAWVSIVSLLFLYLFVARFNIVASDANGLHAFWGEEFPPLTNPFSMIYWILDVHSGMMYAYPAGAHHFGCIVQFILWLIGVRSFWRKDRRWLTALLLAPQAMLFLGSILRLYPYGGNARICLFLAPAMCIFIAAGLVEISRLLHRQARQKMIRITAAVLLCFGIGGIGWDLIDPVVFRPQPTIRTALEWVSDQSTPQDTIVCLNEQCILRGGGGPRQIFEFYMVRALHQTVRWNASFPVSQIPTAHHLFVIVFQNQSTPNPAIRVQSWINANCPAFITPLGHINSAYMRQQPGQVYVYEFGLAPAPSH